MSTRSRVIVPNFIKIGQTVAETWRFNGFQNGGRTHSQDMTSNQKFRERSLPRPRPIMERFAIGRLELIIFNLCTKFVLVPSVLWRCWLGGRKCIRPVKTVVGCWHGYLSGARCRLHMAQRMPLPLTVSCFGKFQISFNFLVPALMGSPGHRALKRVYACTKFEVSIFSS